MAPPPISWPSSTPAAPCSTGAPALTGRLPVEVEEGLWDLVARGLVTLDGFQAVRSLWSAREVWRRRHHRDVRGRLGTRRRAGLREGGEGRWALLPRDVPAEDPDHLAEAVAAQLLARWGVVFWDLTGRETLSVPWRDVHWALRRLEARWAVRGGRFVSGFTGEQFAVLPEAVEELRRIRWSDCLRNGGAAVRRRPAQPGGHRASGFRVPAVRQSNWVTYRDGRPCSRGLDRAGRPNRPGHSVGSRVRPRPVLAAFPLTVLVRSVAAARSGALGRRAARWCARSDASDFGHGG